VPDSAGRLTRTLGVTNHVMSVFSRLVNALRSLVPETPGPSFYPEARTDLALLLLLLRDPAIGRTLGAFGLDPDDVQSRLAVSAPLSVAGDHRALNNVRASAVSAAMAQLGSGLPDRSKEEDHLGFLILQGSDTVQRVITELGVEPAAIAFWLAHRQHERELRHGWPAIGTSDLRVRIVNDPYSPMEFVHRSLVEAFGVPNDKAVELMLKVHHEGAVTVEPPNQKEAVSFCDSCNQRWRATRVPLYIRPVIAAEGDA
jgi:ATP-dependent Clp protease adapter protein ClpS